MSSAPPFAILRPAEPARPSPLVCASPHSGRLYPPELMNASALDASAIRRSEDAFVDLLVQSAPRHGVPLIQAMFARAFIDVNRAAYDLDPRMFEDEVPAYARGHGARVAAGLGSIPRVVAEGQEIYSRKLRFSEAHRRIETVHQPYHQALGELLTRARTEFGAAVLLDWHSMPAAAAGDARGRTPDIVLGDRFGAACSPIVTERVEAAFKGLGFRVARNTPYAGGFSTETYGRPHTGVHALQIEMNRALYLDESRTARTVGFARLAADLDRLFAALAAVDWRTLK